MNYRITLVALTLIYRCERFDTRLKVFNMTERKICVETDLDTVPYYPSINMTEFYLNNSILSNDSNHFLEWGVKGWSSVIENSRNKKLNLFVFDYDSLLRYRNIDTLIKNRIYDRYEFSEMEMDSMKWKVRIHR